MPVATTLRSVARAGWSQERASRTALQQLDPARVVEQRSRVALRGDGRTCRLHEERPPSDSTSHETLPESCVRPSKVHRTTDVRATSDSADSSVDAIVSRPATPAFSTSALVDVHPVGEHVDQHRDRGARRHHQLGGAARVGLVERVGQRLDLGDLA